MFAASSQVPAAAAAPTGNRRYLPLVLVANQETISRFPEKTSKWWLSQLVCQPRPLSLVRHASQGSVARLEQMADLNCSEQPPARSDQSLYVYYTLDSASPPNTQEAAPSYRNLAHTMATTADASSNALALGLGANEMDDASWKAMLEQWNDATHLDLLEYDGQPYLSLPDDGIMFPVDLPSYLSPTSQPSQPYPTNSSVASPLVMNTTHENSLSPQFPPIPPPASSLPIPSCLREDLPAVPVAPGITGEQEYTPLAFRPAPPLSMDAAAVSPTHCWPPTSPPASSLPVPSWYASLSQAAAPVASFPTNAAVAAVHPSYASSKDRAHRQNVMEKRRARRSSPSSTPRLNPAQASRPERSSGTNKDNLPASLFGGSASPAPSARKSAQSMEPSAKDGQGSSIGRVKGVGGRRRKPLKPLYTFAPRDNLPSSGSSTQTSPRSPYNYVAAPRPLAMVG